MNKKVSELSGAELDYWVARALGLNAGIVVDGGFNPSRRWHDIGPIIEKHKISLNFRVTSECIACIEQDDTTRHYGRGPTPQLAACRAFVASVYGDEVECD